MLGGRQDHALAAAFELWWNRPIAVDYLDFRSAQEPTRSKLRDAIAVNLRCIEIVGALMARAVLFDKVRADSILLRGRRPEGQGRVDYA